MELMELMDWMDCSPARLFCLLQTDGPWAYQPVDLLIAAIIVSLSGEHVLVAPMNRMQSMSSGSPGEISSRQPEALRFIKRDR